MTPAMTSTAGYPPTALAVGSQRCWQPKRPYHTCVAHLQGQPAVIGTTGTNVPPYRSQSPNSMGCPTGRPEPLASGSSHDGPSIARQLPGRHDQPTCAAGP